MCSPGGRLSATCAVRSISTSSKTTMGSLPPNSSSTGMRCLAACSITTLPALTLPDGPTTVIIEDIAVPIEHLRDCLLELQEHFKRYDYEDTIIWGHVFDGNVHFVLTLDFADADDITLEVEVMESAP